MRAIAFVVAAFGCVFSPFSVSAQEAIRFATLEWPPYVSSDLPSFGFSARLLQEIARDNGADARFAFLPWVRAMRYGQEDPGFAGYFPAYWTEERARTCNFSDVMGLSQVGFVERKDSPIKWNRLQDLTDVQIGVVNGYSNGPEFDTLVADGSLQVEGASSDINNLHKVALGRLKLAVVDKAVMEYYLIKDPLLRAKRDEISFNPKPIVELTLHVCFKKNQAGARLKALFDKGIQGYNIVDFQNAYLYGMGQ